MPDIKTRDIAKGTIKTIDKSAVAAERMKSAFIQTKEKAEHSVSVPESSAEEYASNRLESGIDRVSHDAIHQFDKQGRKGVKETKQNIVKAKDGIQKFKEKRAAQSLQKQTTGTVRNKSIKAAEETQRTVKETARSAGKKTINVLLWIYHQSKGVQRTMFGENLKTLRKQKGFSQEELAVRLHVVRQTVSKWEKNLSVPDADTLIRLAEILEVSVSELLGAKIENENTASDVAEQLSRINEQLAIKNRRSRRIWKIVAIILAAIVLINIFIAVFFSVPNLNEGIPSNQPEITDQTQIIEE